MNFRVPTDEPDFYIFGVNTVNMNNPLERFNSLIESFKDYRSSDFLKPLSIFLIDNSKNILSSLIENNLIPSDIYPTDESIIFEFKVDSNRHQLEIFEDSDVVLVLKGVNTIYLDFILSEISTAITVLKNHIEAQV